MCVCFRRLSDAVYGSLQPLSEMLTSCLHSRLSVHCHVINTHLLHVLHHHHSLLDCFTIIRVCHCDTSLLSLLLILHIMFSYCIVGRYGTVS